MGPAREGFCPTRAWPPKPLPDVGFSPHSALGNPSRLPIMCSNLRLQAPAELSTIPAKLFLCSGLQKSSLLAG